jgi:uncharacterized protein (DUF1800 family)
MKLTTNVKALRLGLLSIALGSAALSSVAQVLPETSPAAVWRATSRLGYGPTPALAQAAQPSAKAWSLAQLDEAKQASQRPPQLPTGLQMLAATQEQVSVKYHQENEARRLGREKTQAGMLSMEPTGAGASSTTQVAQAASAVGAADDPENFSRDMAQAAAHWRLASCSHPAVENPLLARMTEFWFNHFNVFTGKGPVRPYLGSYLLTAIRPHALGKFEDLLLATAQHPAMLLYLDQAQSNARGLNENYARELMELHTLGVNGGYTQADVRELARMLTGWSVEVRGGRGFVFRPRAHEEGSKSIMGRTFSESGQAQGVAAIQYLAQHPATAQRISGRLATFFVADKPSKTLVDKLAASFTQSGGDIQVVMRTLIESREFWEASNTLFKTPMDYACSSLAAAGVVKDEANDKQNLRQATGFLAQTGQPLNGWQTPDGYKTDAATWLAPEALTRRADFAFGIAPRIEEPVYLQQFYSSAARERIAKEAAPHMRTSLLLAAPEFMSK